MAASSNVLSTLRRPISSVASVENSFRNAVVYKTKRRISEDLLPKFDYTSTPMVLLFTWLGAKERSGHKFVESWTKRGFDVMHVSTSVHDLLRPRNGAEVTANRIVDYFDRRPEGSKVMVHGISVGAYLTQRMFMAASSSSNVMKRVKYQIYDSFTNVDGMANGVENGVPPRYRRLATHCMKFYNMFADRSSFFEAQEFMLTTPVPFPTLFIHSLADRVARFPDSTAYIEAQKRVSPVDVFLIPESQKIPHVAIFRCLGDELYMKKIFEFIETADTTKKKDEDDS